MHLPVLDALLLSLLLAGQAAAVQTPVPLQDDPPLGDTPVIRVLLAAALETTLSSQMNGTLASLNAGLGQQVSKGGELAAFSCNEANAKAKVANAELAMARQNHDAKRNLRKLDAVGDLEVAVAATEVQKAEGALSMSQAQSGYCKVQAPFTGRVAKVYVKPYQTLAAGTPLIDLVSDDALKVRLNVPSALLPRLRQGQALHVSISETGKQYPATISAINARVDAVAQTVELEARLDAVYPELIAGMSGTASFAHDHE